MSQHYFAADGNYGDAKDLVIIHTDKFTEDDWELIESSPDRARHVVAEHIAQQKEIERNKRVLRGL